MSLKKGLFLLYMVLNEAEKYLSDIPLVVPKVRLGPLSLHKLFWFRSVDYVGQDKSPIAANKVVTAIREQFPIHWYLGVYPP